MPPLTLEISNRFDRLEAPHDAARMLFERLETSGSFPVAGGELSVVFVTDEEIARIHRDFMDDPTPTDVITFPADHEMESAGEIIVSVDHAESRAAELAEPFSRELSLYLIHGWLHLAGYDDRNEADRAAMRQAEAQALAIIDQSPAKIEFRLRP
ncbi:MAG: rRNA maturation RNase YbeY [Verrucomicrobiota bacterium]